MEIIKDESHFGMIDWWKKVFLENFANFEGRARRAEYWCFTLFNPIVLFGFAILTAITVGISGGNEPGLDIILIMILFVGYALAVTIPSIAVAVRRLHDK